MRRVPDLDQKLDTLMSLAADDRDGAPPRLRHARTSGALGPLNIRQLQAVPGNGMRLLRILMTNACRYNCHYCPMRRDRELPRTLLKPAELVRIFLGALGRGWVDGLFVTTGIPSNPVRVVDGLIEALELLRERHRFGGYIHVKLVAGAQEAQIERLTALASRVSLNLEAPCGQHLTAIAPEKSLPVALADLERVRSLVLAERVARAHGRPADPLHPGGVSGLTLQFVVGATPDSDRTMLDTVAGLRARGGVHHTHFSAFRPIADTPMESVPATPAIREHRLYQAEHLLREYGFAADEVVNERDGNLPLAIDPQQHRGGQRQHRPAGEDGQEPRVEDLLVDAAHRLDEGPVAARRQPGHHRDGESEVDAGQQPGEHRRRAEREVDPAVERREVHAVSERVVCQLSR